jgi:hypothetical protein
VNTRTRHLFRPADDAKLAKLWAQQSLTIRQIADQMGWPERRVKARASHLRKQGRELPDRRFDAGMTWRVNHAGPDDAPATQPVTVASVSGGVLTLKAYASTADWRARRNATRTVVPIDVPAAPHLGVYRALLPCGQRSAWVSVIPCHADRATLPGLGAQIHASGSGSPAALCAGLV